VTKEVKDAGPWAYAVEYQRDDGEVHAYCAAIPEAIASGSTEAEAAHEMVMALEAAVRGRMKDGMELPLPDGTGASVVALPAQLAAKAAIYAVWRSAGVSKTELARRMDRNEAEIRRVLDPEHGTKLDQLAEAAAALGGRLEVRFVAS
jgi:antitoxin HicB